MGDGCMHVLCVCVCVLRAYVRVRACGRGMLV